MAIYHFQSKIISRQQGRGVIAAAAYRAGECLFDHELGRSQNYSAKLGVVHSEILLPAGAPSRWLDRETLWNEVAAGEVRRDGAQRKSQLAREIEIALPRELSQAEAIRLAQDFVREQFVARGMVADLNAHWGTAADGGAQPHAHVLLTMRGVDPRGSRQERIDAARRAGRRRQPQASAGGAADVSEDPGLDAGGSGRVEASERAGFGLKERAWNDRALIGLWRQRWAEMVNARLAELGHDVRVDHRSNAARGLDLAPQNKIGPAASRRARKGEDGERTAEHRAIARRNGEQLLAEPELALRALTQQHSTFTRHDLARLIDRQSDGAAQFAAVMAMVEASPELVRVGADGRGQARFSTREMVQVEQELIAGAVALNKRTTHRVGDKRRLAALAGTRLSEEQHLAYLHVTRSRDLAVVVGIAGGGKSTMLGTARAVWAAQGYRVRGAALSGIAAEGLEGSAGIESRTVASWEHAWDAGKEQLGARDVLVVDEAGMIGSRQLGRLVARAQQAGAKLVLVGDAEQLQAIEAGAAFRAIADQVGVIAITEPRRQRQEWQRLATKELATARSGDALGRYQAAGMVHKHATREAARDGAIAGWDAARQESPQQSQIILTHERAEVRMLNEAARAVRRAAGELGPEHRLQVEAGPRAFAVGDRLYFLRNERGLGVKNGTLGTVERIEVERIEPRLDGARLTVRLDEPEGAGTGRAVSFALAEYADIDHGYAATVHKSQGVTVDQAHVLATPGMDRHLTYVAMSRHRHAAQLHWGADEFGNRLHVVLGRERAKDTTLDYAEFEPDPVAAYAERRALTPTMPVSEIVVRTPELTEVPAPVHADRASEASGSLKSLEPPLRRPTGHVTLIDVPAPEAPRPQPAPSPEPGLAAEARPAARPLADQWPWDQVPAETGTPAPLLPAIPYQPITAEDVAAAVDADEGVERARFELRDALAMAYRDQGKAGEKLAILEGQVGAGAVAACLAKEPGLLGKLRGRGWSLNVNGAVERALARDFANRVGERLVAQREAEGQAADAYHDPLRKRRRAEAVEVPGLSGKALAAIETVSLAGAAPGRTGVLPWEPRRPPRPEEIAWAARVAPVWAAVRADTDLHDELRRFQDAVDKRLPTSHDTSPAPPSERVKAVRVLARVLYSANSLFEQHPALQEYAAAEPERQARAARATEARRREAEQRAEATRRAEAEQVEAERAREEWRKHNPAPWPSPSPGMG